MSGFFPASISRNTHEYAGMLTLNHALFATKSLGLPAKMAKALLKGMEVEMEHGKKYGLNLTNATDDDLILTAKIALAHIYEFPDYYVRLEKMEKEADKYWKKRDKKRRILRKAIFGQNRSI